MIKIGDKKLNLLRLACSNPTAVLHELQDLCDKILGKRLSHRERIATQQKRTYGEPDYLSKKEVDDYIYTSADEKRIQYYLGNIGKMKISLDRNNTKFTHDAKPRHLRIEEYETIRQAFHKNRIKQGYTHLYSIYSYCFLTNISKNSFYISPAIICRRVFQRVSLPRPEILKIGQLRY